MSYDKKVVTTVTHSGVLAAGSSSRGIKRMPGKRYCRIVDIQTCVTTQVVATSTTPILNYGDGTTAAKFAAQNCGAVAATVAVGVTYNTRDADGRVAAYCSSGNTPYIDWDSAGNGGAALTTLVISVTAGTGGSVAGAYDVQTVLEWW